MNKTKIDNAELLFLKMPVDADSFFVHPIKCNWRSDDAIHGLIFSVNKNGGLTLIERIGNLKNMQIDEQIFVEIHDENFVSESIKQNLTSKIEVCILQMAENISSDAAMSNFGSLSDIFKDLNLSEGWETAEVFI